MAVDRDPNFEPGPSVELLPAVGSGPPRSVEADRSWWPLLVVFGAGVLLYLVFVLTPAAEEIRVGRVRMVETHFANPFEVDWVGLEGPAAASASPTRPVPMVALDPPCLGFARPDWPEGNQHPSVAHCVDAGVMEQLSADDSVGLWRFLAGGETWYFLLFGSVVGDVEIQVDGGSILRSDEIYRSGSVAAMTVPTDSSDLSLSWRLRPGVSYRCRFDAQADTFQDCA